MCEVPESDQQVEVQRDDITIAQNEIGASDPRSKQETLPASFQSLRHVFR
jgi:hypothetical protein